MVKWLAYFSSMLASSSTTSETEAPCGTALQRRSQLTELGRRADSINLDAAIAEVPNISLNSYTHRDALREVAIADSLDHAGNMEPLRDSCVGQFASSRE